MFKIKITLLSLLTCFTLLSTAQVCASEKNKSPLSYENQEIKEDSANDNIEVSDRLNSFDEQKKILQLPDGSLLQGSIEIYDGENLIASYDSETDANSQTKIEVEKDLVENNQNSNPLLRVDIAGFQKTPGNYITILSYGTRFQSNKCSGGSGWRFSVTAYTAAANSGGSYLRWKTFKDSARIGSTSQAKSTLNGTLSGKDIYTGSYYWVDCGKGVGQNYYTYNPAAGSYYEVANVEP